MTCAVLRYQRHVVVIPYRRFGTTYRLPLYAA